MIRCQGSHHGRLDFWRRAKPQTPGTGNKTLMQVGGDRSRVRLQELLSPTDQSRPTRQRLGWWIASPGRSFLPKTLKRRLIGGRVEINEPAHLTGSGDSEVSELQSRHRM